MRIPACSECAFYTKLGLIEPACDHPEARPDSQYDIVTGVKKEILYRCYWMRSDQGLCGAEAKLYAPNLWARIKITLNDWLSPF